MAGEGPFPFDSAAVFITGSALWASAVGVPRLLDSGPSAPTASELALDLVSLLALCTILLRRHNLRAAMAGLLIAFPAALTTGIALRSEGVPASPAAVVSTALLAVAHVVASLVALDDPAARRDVERRPQRERADPHHRRPSSARPRQLFLLSLFTAFGGVALMVPSALGSMVQDAPFGGATPRALSVATATAALIFVAVLGGFLAPATRAPGKGRPPRRGSPVRAAIYLTLAAVGTALFLSLPATP